MVTKLFTHLMISSLCPPSSISAGIVRASSVFPILSTCLLMLGGLCVGVGRVYNKTNNVLLSAGILFVAAGELEDYNHAPSEEQSFKGCGGGRFYNEEGQLDVAPVDTYRASSVVQS